MSEPYVLQLRAINRQLAENTKKMDEIESRIDKIVAVCTQANITLPSEIANALTESLKEARDLKFHV